MGGRVALEERKLRLTSAKVEVEVEAELGKNIGERSASGSVMSLPVDCPNGN